MSTPEVEAPVVATVTSRYRVCDGTQVNLGGVVYTAGQTFELEDQVTVITAATYDGQVRNAAAAPVRPIEHWLNAGWVTPDDAKPDPDPAPPKPAAPKRRPAKKAAAPTG